MKQDHDQFLSMAFAYLEIGRIVSISSSELSNTSEYENAKAYQLYHAIELFYKYMIIGKKGKIAHIHDLKKLEDEYLKIYSDTKFKLEHPFNFSEDQFCIHSENEKSLTKQHMEKFKPSYMDQHLRYPIDERTGGYSFFLDESVFEAVKEQIVSIVQIGA